MQDAVRWHDVAVGYEDMLDLLLCWHLILTPFLWSPSGYNEAQGVGISGGKSWVRCLLSSRSSALAAVRECVEAMMPFNWDATNMRGQLSQVSLSEKYVFAV